MSILEDAIQAGEQVVTRAQTDPDRFMEESWLHNVETQMGKDATWILSSDIPTGVLPPSVREWSTYQHTLIARQIGAAARVIIAVHLKGAAMNPRQPDTMIEVEAQHWRDLRPEVQTFASQMETQLRAHDGDRGPAGWKDDEVRGLFRHLKMEVKELEQALIRWEGTAPRDPDDAEAISQVQKEAADIGNMAMMVADVVVCWNGGDK